MWNWFKTLPQCSNYRDHVIGVAVFLLEWVDNKKTVEYCQMYLFLQLLKSLHSVCWSFYSLDLETFSSISPLALLILKQCLQAGWINLIYFDWQHRALIIVAYCTFLFSFQPAHALSAVIAFLRLFFFVYLVWRL